MDGAPFSTSVLGFRPFTLAFPTPDVARTFEPRPTSAPSATTSSAPIPTRSIRNPHLAPTADSPTTSVLTIVLPTLFSALLLLGIGIALLSCLSRRAKNKQGTQSAKLRKPGSAGGDGGVEEAYDPAQWSASARREMVELELDDVERRTSSLSLSLSSSLSLDPASAAKLTRTDPQARSARSRSPTRSLKSAAPPRTRRTTSLANRLPLTSPERPYECVEPSSLLRRLVQRPDSQLTSLARSPRRLDHSPSPRFAVRLSFFCTCSYPCILVLLVIALSARPLA